MTTPIETFAWMIFAGVCLLAWVLTAPAPTKGVRVRILSGAHDNHFGDLVRIHRGKALVRLRDGACVWVEDGEWVRVGGGE
jgi:hypothetical protein